MSAALFLLGGCSNEKSPFEDPPRELVIVLVESDAQRADEVLEDVRARLPRGVAIRKSQIDLRRRTLSIDFDGASEERVAQIANRVRRLQGVESVEHRST